MIDRCGSTVLRSLLALAALAAIATLMITRDASATDFAPVYSLCLDNASTPDAFPPPAAEPCDGDVTPGAPVDTRGTFGISKPSYNFGGNVGFVPAGFLAGTDPNIPRGAIVGKLWSKATLGLINNPCSNPIVVDFTFFYSSIDITQTIDPKAPGQQNELEPLAADADQNGLPDAVDRYPSYLNRIFDPDYNKGPDGKYGTGDDDPGPTAPLQPVARATGFQIPSGTGVQVVLLFMLFAPGTDFRTLNNPDLPVFDTALGYPSVTVLQNPTVPASPSAITDFCSPLDVFGYTFGVSRDNPCTPAPGPAGCPADPDSFAAPFPLNADPEGCDGPGPALPDPDNNEASCVTRKNPAAGTYRFTQFSRSLRDADDDGHENTLDTCPFEPNPGFNPRSTDTSNDPDTDGLPGTGAPGSGCDPDPFNASGGSTGCKGGTYGGDQENDCYPNRGDNCPLIPNDQNDTDSDQIGNECDPNPTTADGHRHEICISADVTIPSSNVAAVGAVYAPPCQPLVNQPVPCTADGDADGVCDDTDRCPGTPAGATVDLVGCTPTQATQDDDNDGVLNASDACPGTAAGASIDAQGCAAGQTPLKAPSSGGSTTGTTGSTGTTTAGGVGGPVTGVGSLSPVAGSVPAWAAILAAFGASGAIGSLGYFGARLRHRRY